MPKIESTKQSPAPESQEDNLQSGAVAITLSKNIVGSSALSTDSIFALRSVPKGYVKTDVALANLPTTVSSYLNTKFVGYTFVKAFSTAVFGTTTVYSYVVAINYNNKPVAIKFLASGDFKAILELREGADLKTNIDQHVGGAYEIRNTALTDSLALSALSATIKTYMTTKNVKDTLKSAWVNKDGTVVLLSKNGLFFGNTFTTAGVSIARVTLPSVGGKDIQVAKTALPLPLLSYLAAAFPNYVYEKAYSFTPSTLVKGFAVVIDANLTKYYALFDHTGVFLSATTIR